mmetsp:Transcript_8725/g.11813  ORF Transcript_8725/g.11813 Transcript_8725/m.11813 type:complete len:275 (-) Transcript_8725:226-1050(-)|eukprot:CAMPEP_0196578984 /NCGR_PEP_ID=MMETSP1081-20130531/15267_1 /TAXON_ID=36882 /ORGANISM="Pyramimonas amylifera, Strain CCMP720" /LENGTH=274 /DNA_ID=CAMNT_0041898403 /DNA_START=112 /DNA_END=936 /DNA_ORIENTATION=+
MVSCALSSLNGIIRVGKSQPVCERKVQLRKSGVSSSVYNKNFIGFKQATKLRTNKLVVRADSDDEIKETPKTSSTLGNAIVVPPDYRIGGILCGVALILGPLLHDWYHFLVHAVLGGFLIVQSSRVRFRITDKDLEVIFVDNFSDDTEEAQTLGVDSSGVNYLQGGGENKWALSSITNWEFWWPGFPVIVFYKETQTKADGQIHFFPVLSNGKKLYEAMLSSFPKSVNPKPDPNEWNLLTAFEQTRLGKKILEQLDDDQKATLKGISGMPVVDK